MARTARSTPFASDELTAEEQAQFDQMRADDGAPADAPARTPRTPRMPAIEADAAAPPADEPSADVDAEPEADPEAPDAPGAPQADTIRKVNGALKEERDRRRDIEQQLAEERRQRQVLDERTNLLLQRIAGAQQPAAPAPDAPKIPEKDQDPIGHFDQRIAPLEAAVRQMTQGVQQQSQQAQAQQVMQQVVGRCMEQEANFRTETPDYDSAAQFLRESRDRQLQAIGMDNPLERKAWIDNEAQQIAVGSVQRRTNFAKAIYDLAVVSGYTKAAPAPAADPTPAVDPAARLEQQRQGQQQARSLGSARGSAPPPALTAQRLAEMPEAQFNAMLEKMTAAEKRNIFGN